MLKGNPSFADMLVGHKSLGSDPLHDDVANRYVDFSLTVAM